MANLLIQELNVTSTFILMKFSRTIKVSTIANSVFTLTNTDTSTVVSSPFKTINIVDDYNSISRELTLYWVAGKLLPDTDYSLKISELYDSASNLIEDVKIVFRTTSDISIDPTLVPVNQTVLEVKDHSIKAVPFGSFIANPDYLSFFIVEVDPENGEYFLDPDYREGRITVKFSKVPQVSYLNATYFKVQKKPIQRTPSRWIQVHAVISKDSTKPWVYIDLPALDDATIYTTAGHNYYAPNYKYRVIISKYVSN